MIPGFVFEGNKQTAREIKTQIEKDAGKDLRNGSYWEKVGTGERELEAKLSQGAFWVAGEKYSLMMDFGTGGQPTSSFEGSCIMIPGFVFEGNKQTAREIKTKIEKDAGKDLRNGSYWEKVGTGESEKN
jgi:hypothetical protein